jgi:hypothetical protein
VNTHAGQIPRWLAPALLAIGGSVVGFGSWIVLQLTELRDRSTINRERIEALERSLLRDSGPMNSLERRIERLEDRGEQRERRN